MATRFPGITLILQKLGRHKSLHVLCALAALTVLVRLGMFVVYEPYYEGDTQLLVKDHINAIRRCLSEGLFPGCPDPGDFPLVQNIPSLILNYAGFSPDTILHALAYLSFVSFLGSVVLIFWVLKRKASLLAAAAGVLVIITSPLLWYSHSTFGEMLSAFLILAFTVVSLWRPYKWIHVFLLAAAGSTKEVALPFLLLIGVICLAPEIVTDWRKVRKSVAWLAFGGILSLALTLGFNYFRFRIFTNPSYVSEPLFIVPSLKLQLSFFLGMWLSPNGGLLFVWPSFTFLYFSILLVVVLRRMRNGQLLKRESLNAYLPLSGISVLLLFLTLGFSRWYTPLGGFAWGPRYLLPWIPAVTVLLIYFYRSQLALVLSWSLIKPARFLLSNVVLILASIPQFAILFDSSVMARIFSYPECPRVPVIQEGVDYYYQCLQTQIWPKRFFIAQLYQVAITPPALWFVLLYAAAVIWICYVIRGACLGATPLKEQPLSNRLPISTVVSSIRTAIGSDRYHALVVIFSYSLLFLAFFLPVILKDHLLAVGGDGLYIYLPNFYSKKVLWDLLLFAGFPMMADPQVMTWYPPATLLSLLPNGWNIFMLFGYVAASSFTYGYVYSLTNSRLAGAVSGSAFGLGGFMISHLGHAVIVHSTAWIPLTIWSLEMLRRSRSARWFVAGSVALAMSCMAGQSQIFLYGLVLSGFYLLVAGWTAPVGRWRYYSVSFAMMFAGIALSAVQLLPTAELVGQGMRVLYSFQDFVSHALPPRQALTMIFPLVFGGVPESGAIPYFGGINQTELTGYAGLLPIVLASIGVITTRRKSLSLFWPCVALVAFLLAMGDGTPLARVVYHIPLISQVRAPARHFLELTFAVSVLAGLGVAAIINRQVSMRQLIRVILVSILLMLGCLVLLFLNSSYMAGLAAKQGISKLPLLPWNNSAVGIPLLVFLLGLGALIYWYKEPRSGLRSVLLLAVLLIDLGSFGWFYEWRYANQEKSAVMPTPQAAQYKNLLRDTNQRLMPYRGPRGTRDEMPPNLTRLWGVPSASGYNTLMLARVRSLLPMIDFIDVPLPWMVPADQSLNLVAARYFVMPRLNSIEEREGVSWLKNDMQIWLGSGCTQPPRDLIEFQLPSPIKATSLALVTRLACSPAIPQGAEVARYHLTDAGGVVHSGSIRAGLDSSEWAYDCNNVKPIMQHQQARIFKDYPANMGGAPCAGHFYLATLDLDRPAEIKTLQLEWVGSGAAIIIEKVSLIDKLTNASYPIDLTLVSADHWRFVEETNEARVYENLKAMPRAWLVSNVFTTNAEEALNAIKTSRLSDGRGFNPAQVALVEEPVALPSQDEDSEASATVVALSDTKMEVHTSSKISNFLVTSDVYYPGWEARIDGAETSLYRANYALRGVVVPPGDHIVLFEYRPRRFQLGAIISLLSVVGLGAISFGYFLFGGQAERKRGSV
ncbi:MAG: YfhO family protein [Pyrinomonadaceae bacterium]